MIRLSTIGAAATLGLATAAMAQVVGTPIEQKSGSNASNDLAVDPAGNTTANSAAPANATDPMSDVPDATTGTKHKAH